MRVTRAQWRFTVLTVVAVIVTTGGTGLFGQQIGGRRPESELPPVIDGRTYRQAIAEGPASRRVFRRGVELPAR